MKNFIEKNLSLRFGLILVLSVSFMISLFTCLIVLKNIYSAEKQLNIRLENITKTSRTGLATALWQFNNQYVQDFTKSLFLSDDVVFVKVMYKGKAAAKKAVDKYKTKDFSYFKSSPKFLVETSEIYFKEYHVGTMQIALSKKIIKDSLWEATKTTLVLIILVITSILFTTFYMIKKYLFKPLSRLEHLMTRVSEGELDTTFSTGKKDALGRLADKIDFMLSAMKKITASRDELNHQILERKKTEHALRVSEEKFREFVEGTDNLITHIDKAGNYIYLNPVAENVLGLSQKNLKGMRALNFLHKHDKDNAKKWFKKNTADKKNKAFIENRLINIITGEVTYWLWTAHFFYDKGEFSGLNFIGHNVTKLKTAEYERAKLESQLRQAHKLEAVGTLAGGIAHDFNNILGIILGNAELAHMYSLNKDEKAVNKISEIVTASLRAKDVVSQLLSFSRKSEIKKVPLKLDSIVNESAKLLRSSIESSINIKLDIEQGLKIINAEPTQIHQIIINLCTNSAHAMEDSGGEIVISLNNIHLDFELSQYLGVRQGYYVKLVVEDTGHGIPIEIRERVFDPYFTTKKTGKGSGMGLSVTHGIVKSHNGAINIKSTTGKGTAVSIYFPAVNFTPEKPAQSPKDTPLGNEKILFVDDEKSLVIIVEEFLKNLGYQVKTFTNPVEALEHFKENYNEYDMVITDMTMPQMYGDKLSKEILKIKKDIPIIICSGYSDKIDEEKTKNTGISLYIEKPFDNKQFALAIRKLLNKSKNVVLN